MQGVLERMSTVAASDIGIPVVVVSELLYGAHRSARAEENLTRVREYVSRFDVLPADAAVFERYAAVRPSCRTGADRRATSIFSSRAPPSFTVRRS
jgi:predicted nucleic acid-binding protein